MTPRYLSGLLLVFLFNSSFSQSTAQLTITPANPTPSDTIYVISTLTYSGSCSYGLVYTYTSVTGNTISVMPTYCGHGSTNTCVSTDTLKIAPLPAGNYVIVVEYHQGSVCPISNFDATIGQEQATLMVSTGVQTELKERSVGSQFRIYPNPTADLITVEAPGLPAKCLVNIRNVLGQVVMRRELVQPSGSMDLGTLPNGMYTLELEISGNLVSRQPVLIQRR